MKCFSFKYFLVFMIVLLAFCTHLPNTYASVNKIVIPTEFQELNVSDKLEVFIDQNHLPKEKILEQQDHFIPLQEAEISGDISDSIYWLKLTLSNSSSLEKELLLELKKPHLSRVTLYSLENNKLFQEETIGYSLPYDTRN